MNISTKKTTNLALSAMFIAIGLFLPFVTGQIPQIGKMLLPMHIPVILCGLVCGWQYGLVVGVIVPLLRGFVFGMPVLYPTAIAMSFELAAYGCVAGLMYSYYHWHCMKALYQSLIAAMISGRLVWGVVQFVLLGMGNTAFTWQMFMVGAFLNAIPGIVLQLVLIPAIMMVLNRTFVRESGEFMGISTSRKRIKRIL